MLVDLCCAARADLLSCCSRCQAILGGDYILICASQMLAKIGNTEAVSVVADLINDLIKGEGLRSGGGGVLMWVWLRGDEYMGKASQG